MEGPQFVAFFIKIFLVRSGGCGCRRYDYLRLYFRQSVVNEGLLMVDASDTHTQRLVHLAHPNAVSARQVIIDGYNVNALAGKRVQVRRQGCNQCFAFTCHHFRDSAPMKDDPAYKLDIKVSLAESPSRRLSDGREGLRQ